MKRFFLAALAVLFAAATVSAQQLPNPSFRGANFFGPFKVEHPTAATGSLLGPDGLNIIPFGTYRGLTYLHSAPGSHSGNGLAGFTSAVTGDGSTVFGPSAADVAGLFSATKNNHLSSAIEGEMLSLYGIANQGQKGDAAVLLGATTKVRAGAGDTGGALGYELRAATVDPANTIINAVHTYAPYMAPTSDMSGGGGYGTYVESFNGTNYTAFQAGNYLPADAATGWKNILSATTDRTSANTFFNVRGTKGLTGSQQPGDITIGTGVNALTLRNNLGILQVRNDTDTASLMEINKTGAFGIPQDPAWASYTPTITCGTGTPTATSATGHFKGIGKITLVRLAITITTAGTCGSSVNATLPANVQFGQVLFGRGGASPKMLMASTSGTGTANIFITDYNNGFVGASGDVLIINGSYASQ